MIYAILYFSYAYNKTKKTHTHVILYIMRCCWIEGDIYCKMIVCQIHSSVSIWHILLVGVWQQMFDVVLVGGNNEGPIIHTHIITSIKKRKKTDLVQYKHFIAMYTHFFRNFSYQNQQPVVIVVNSTSTENSFWRSVVITAHHNWRGGWFSKVFFQLWKNVCHSIFTRRTMNNFAGNIKKFVNY